MSKLTYYSVFLTEDDDEPRNFTNYSMALVYCDLVLLRFKDAGLPLPQPIIKTLQTEASLPDGR